MEDNNKLKLNSAADLPEVPRDENNNIILEAITTGIDEKGNKIIPDDIFNAYYNELPEKIINQSKTWRTTATGGKIKIFGGDPVSDRAIQIKGAETVNAAKAQRRTFAEVIEEMLTRPAKNEVVEDLQIEPGATNLEAIIAATLKQASRGNVKAADFLRDTIGQKPSEKIQADVTALTAEDKEMLARIQARLDSM